MTLPFPARHAALLALVAALAFGCKKNKPDPARDDAPRADAPVASPGAPPAPAPVAGGPVWTEVRDPVGGFRVKVPGPNRAMNMATAPEELKRLQMTMYQNSIGPKDKGSQVTTYSVIPPGFKIGSSPDELYAGLLQHQKGLMTFQDVLSKESVTLGDRPALKVVTKANNVSPPPKLDDAEAQQRMEEGYRRDLARRRTYLVTTTATRVIVVMIQSEGDPDPAEVKTVMDSFAFL